MSAGSTHKHRRHQITLIADGQSTSHIYINLRDDNNQPIAGMANQLILTPRFTATENPENGETLPGSPIKLSDIKESKPGKYTTILTAGTQSGTIELTTSLNKNILQPYTVNLMKVHKLNKIAKFDFMVSQNKIIADNNDESVLIFTAKDADSKPLNGLPVSFEVSDAAGTTLSKMTEQDGGIYTASLKGNAAKEVTVELQIAGKAVSEIPSPHVTLKPQLIFTKVRVNRAEFDVDKGFPQIGFEGAHFQLLVNGTEANNKDYDWSSSDQNVVVDQNGRVTMVSPLNSYSPTVSIMAKDRDIQNNMQSYTFTLRALWVNSGLEEVLYSQAHTTCDNGGDGFELDFASYITNATETEKRNATRAANGKLWSEWGSMRHYV